MVSLSGMVLKFLTLLFKSLPLYITNIAKVLLVIVQLSPALIQFPESIQHEALDDVREEHTEENTINCIVGEPGDLEIIHSLVDSTRNKESQDTVDHSRAHLILVLDVPIHVFHVVTEGYRTEYNHKCDAHHRHEHKLFSYQTHGLENIAQLLLVAETVDQVDEDQGRVDEGAK